MYYNQRLLLIGCCPTVVVFTVLISIDKMYLSIDFSGLSLFNHEVEYRNLPGSLSCPACLFDSVCHCIGHYKTRTIKKHHYINGQIVVICIHAHIIIKLIYLFFMHCTWTCATSSYNLQIKQLEQGVKIPIIVQQIEYFESLRDYGITFKTVLNC